MTKPVSAAQALDFIIANWEIEAKKLPEKQRKICINNMKPLISEIRDGFNTLRSQGASQGTLEMMAINNIAILKITAQEYCPIEESSKELAKLGKKVSDLAPPLVYSDVDVLEGLWKCSKPASFFDHPDRQELLKKIEAEAFANKPKIEQDLQQNPRIDYFAGRCIKTDVTQRPLDLSSYTKYCVPEMTPDEVIKKCIKEQSNPEPTPHSSHRTVDDLLSETGHGLVAHKIGHRYGKAAGGTVETMAETVSKEAPKTSTSPWRDRVISGTAHATIIETTALAIPIVPAFLAVSGAHGVAEVASIAASHVQKFLDTHSPEEYAHDVPPDLKGECPDLYQAALAAKVILKGAQQPSKALDAIHHKLTETAGGILDAVGLTDENVKKIFNEAAIQFGKLPPMPDGL